MKTIQSLGSCAVRMASDYFSKGKLQGNIGFSSIFSSLGQKSANMLNVNLYASECNLPLNSWEKKMLDLDLQKQYFEYIKKNKADVCVIDLIDERYDLLEIEGAYYLYSEQLKKTNIMDVFPNYNMVSQDSIPIDIREQMIGEYCSKLHEIYSDSEIIMYRAIMVNKYKDNNELLEFGNLEFINRFNSRANLYYDMLYDQLKGCTVIDLPKCAVGNKKHKWGNYPFHYSDDCYKELAFSIDKIIS